MHIRTFGSLMQIWGRCAHWKIANGAENLVFAGAAIHMGVACQEFLKNIKKLCLTTQPVTQII
jgi:hypothetical protein